jgi:hypothetical protein
MFGYLKEKAVFFYKTAYIVANIYLGKPFRQPQIKSTFVPISTTKNNNELIRAQVYMSCK